VSKNRRMLVANVQSGHGSLPPSRTIDIEACTVTSYTMVCSIFYHMKKLLSQPSNEKGHPSALITCSLPTQYNGKKLGFCNFIIDHVNPMARPNSHPYDFTQIFEISPGRRMSVVEY